MDVVDDEDFLADDEREHSPSAALRHPSYLLDGGSKLTDQSEGADSDSDFESGCEEDVDSNGLRPRLLPPQRKLRGSSSRLNQFFLRRIKHKFPLPRTSVPPAFVDEVIIPDIPTTATHLLDLDDRPLDLRELRDALLDEFDEGQIPDEQIKYRSMVQALGTLRGILVTDLNRLDWHVIESVLVAVHTSLHTNLDANNGRGVLRPMLDNPRTLLVSPHQASYISPASSPKSLTLSRRGLRTFIDCEGVVLSIHLLNLAWSALVVLDSALLLSNPALGSQKVHNGFHDHLQTTTTFEAPDRNLMVRSASLIIQIVEDTLSFSDIDCVHLISALTPPILTNSLHAPADMFHRTLRMLSLLCSPESDYCANALKTPLMDSLSTALLHNTLDPVAFQWISVCLQRISWSDQSESWAEQNRTLLIITLMNWISIYLDNVDCVYVGLQTIVSLFLRFQYSDVDSLISCTQASVILYLAREYSDDPQIIDSVASFFISLRGFGSKSYFCDADATSIIASLVETLEFSISQSNFIVISSIVRLLKELSYRDDFLQHYSQLSLDKVLSSVSDIDACDGSLSRMTRSLSQKIQDMLLE